MKKYFIEYKLFLQFLGKFFLVYFLLIFVYRIYIASFCDDCIDEITNNVAILTEKTSNLLGIKLFVVRDFMHFNIIYKNNISARIIEGCNAVSVIILFICFVIAFTGRMKTTFLYVFTGSFMIYILNIFRIILLSILMYYYPNLEHFFHGIVFPLIIYGAVFILWIIWVNKFSRYASK